MLLHLLGLVVQPRKELRQEVAHRKPLICQGLVVRLKKAGHQGWLQVEHPRARHLQHDHCRKSDRR
jgi:hypothetical protein